MHQSKVVWRANPDISFPYAQQSDEADTIKANGVAQDLSAGISNEIAVPLQEQAVAQDSAAQSAEQAAAQAAGLPAAQAAAKAAELSAAQAAAQAQAQENMARNAAIVSETFAALKSSLLSEQSLSDRTHSQLESEITDNERLANDARAEQFATEQQLAAYAQEQSRAAQAQANANAQAQANAHTQAQAQAQAYAQAPSQGYPGQVAPPYAPNQAPNQAYNPAPNQAYNQVSNQGFGSQAPNQMGYAPNQSWQAPVQGQMQMAPAAMQAAEATTLASAANASAPAPEAAQSAPVGGAPSRPDADVYVQPDSSITYLENMMRFLNSKGLRVATYHPAWQYQPNDIILMPYAPYPMPSNRTFVMTNDKKAVWNFLKSEFASRGIAL